MRKGTHHTLASLQKMSYPRGPLRDPVERSWEKVNKRGPDECWPWLGKKTSSKFKYGVFILNGRRKHTKLVLAHRFAYRLEYGDAALPDDICLLHLVCDNPPCCNPRHTGPGTRAQNVYDMDRKGRRVPARGERQRDAKLSYKEADTIRWSHSVGGVSIRTLARWYAVGETTISRVLHDETWVLPKAA
jgi:hypothetical protein